MQVSSTDKLSHGFPKCKIYNDPDDGTFNFSKNDFFLIIPQSNHVLNKNHVLGTFALQIFFEAYMIVIMKNIVKELGALGFELHTPFRYLRGIQPVCKQNYKKYLQVLLQDRCAESKLDLFYLHCHSLYDLHYNVHAMVQITKTKRQPFFCNLRVFLCVRYITTRSLCSISIVIKLSGF